MSPNIVDCTDLTPFGVHLTLASSGAIDPVTQNQLNQLFLRDGLLVIRGLHLSHDEQIEFCRYFGRPYLFVNHDMTACIIGLSESESEELLEQLFRCFYDDANVYEHRWSEGDLILWDNLTLQHSRGRTGNGVRTLQRVTITELGYAQQYPTDVGIGRSLSNATLLRQAG